MESSNPSDGAHTSDTELISKSEEVVPLEGGVVEGSQNVKYKIDEDSPHKSRNRENEQIDHGEIAVPGWY